MKKVLLLSILAAFSFAGCRFSFDPTSDPEKVEEIKAQIIQKENGTLPLFLQEHNTIHSIVIDSVVIIPNSNGEGYLATTWDFDEKQNISSIEWAYNDCQDKYIRKTKSVLVEIDGIFIPPSQSVTYTSHWEEAFRQVQDNEPR